ncbi:hypothetical protein [Labrenzia sp. PHM005]|uniref:hypothetical protein n=1 Tax=Labrenzia sp. PHM005 TaxID=2590016 RepID=UPI00114065BF|nr:hypothetical protein [Labrenzia sp. PHM005]QDG77609.1 hypothetical protein FJ695_18020 [Labrenzia sp. PHM005]
MPGTLKHKAVLLALVVSVGGVPTTSSASVTPVEQDQFKGGKSFTNGSGLMQLAQPKRAGGARAGGRKAAPAKTRPPAAQRPAAPAGAQRSNKNVGVNVNKNVNVNVNRNVRVVRRPVGWRGAHWGAIVFGVTLGTIIVVAANTPPPPPDPSLCWTWTNDALTEGYWYYCDGD